MKLLLKLLLAALALLALGAAISLRRPRYTYESFLSSFGPVDE